MEIFHTTFGLVVIWFCQLPQTASAQSGAVQGVTVGWRDLLTLVGIAIGVIGIIIAVQQNRKAETATEAVRKIKQTLFRQKAAQHFGSVEPKAFLLSGAIRARKWDDAADLATQVGAMLINAAGYCSPLMNEDDKANLDLAANALKYLLESIPVDSNPMPAEAFREMTKHSIAILFAIERLAGR